jgi:hypothetical protein
VQLLHAAPSSAPLPSWSSLAFWLTCPLLVLAATLGVVSLVALFRAPRTDAVKVLSIFVSAFRYIGARAQTLGGSRLELDTDTRNHDACPMPVRWRT